MIRYVIHEDICDYAITQDHPVILHCCNCFNTMGTGIAKSVRKHFPKAYEADCATKKGDKSKLGQYSMATIGTVTVINLYAQYNYGKDGKRYINYAALAEGLLWLSNNLFEERSQGETIGPIVTYKLGCGTAGGQWDIVEEMLERFLPDFEIHVVEQPKE